jgi:hypothetical protein
MVQRWLRLCRIKYGESLCVARGVIPNFVGHADVVSRASGIASIHVVSGKKLTCECT